VTARYEQIPFSFETDKEYAARLIPRLIPIAQYVASLAEGRKITVAHLRRAAVERGVLTGEERGKRLSFLHQVMPLAGGLATDEYRRSDIPKAHSNLNRVWYFPEPRISE
jgi:hypothetical protein